MHPICGESVGDPDGQIFLWIVLKYSRMSILPDRRVSNSQLLLFLRYSTFCGKKIGEISFIWYKKL